MELDCCGFLKESAEVKVRCDCGNWATKGFAYCEWCDELEEMKFNQTKPHTWQNGFITGVLTCSKCRLMPVDEMDCYTDCEV